jgi:hypothetical protein
VPSLQPVGELGLEEVALVIHEYWGTLSIYDHRTPRYRQALMLFDKAVIPIPTEPFGELTRVELERLELDLDYLQREGAAVRFDWNPTEFQEWQQSVAGEAVATYLNKDKQLDTRLQLQWAVDHGHVTLADQPAGLVTAIPVYGTHRAFEAVCPEDEDRVTFEIVIANLSHPADDTPLEDIIRLRQQESFQRSMDGLRRWQTEVVSELVSESAIGKLRELRIRQAAGTLERWLIDYEAALSDAKFRKVRIGVVSALGVGAALIPGVQPLVPALAAAAPAAFSFRTLFRRPWRDVAATECMPAGVIYEARHAAS